ncbi:MAG: hypothetical protein BHV82_04550 [Odoribacter sp. 43_10]|nr:MAG: hypothetical protein BHV82_04550 [Odoribacter sp. 43_10]
MKEKTGQLFKAVGKKIKNFMTPARYIVLGFLGVIAVGTILLVLPFSSASGKTIGFVPALFTSTTAVCVTGLTVIDPATQLSIFGQIVVLLLIQIGGLGFMTTTTFMFMLVGKKISLKERMTIQDLDIVTRARRARHIRFVVHGGFVVLQRGHRHNGQRLRRVFQHFGIFARSRRTYHRNGAYHIGRARLFGFQRHIKEKEKQTASASHARFAFDDGDFACCRRGGDTRYRMEQSRHARSDGLGRQSP